MTAFTTPGRLTPGWRKSSFSTNGGDCVEVSPDGANQVGMRDSKDPAGPVLTFKRSEFRAFILGAKAGEFDEFM